MTARNRIELQRLTKGPAPLTGLIPNFTIIGKSSLAITNRRRDRGGQDALVQKKLLAIVKEAEKTTVKGVCKKYGFSRQRYAVWR